MRSWDTQKENDFRSHALKIPGFGAGPKSTRPEDLGHRQEFKNYIFLNRYLPLTNTVALSEYGARGARSKDVGVRLP
jgi:hypothetical protein